MWFGDRMAFSFAGMFRFVCRPFRSLSFLMVIGCCHFIGSSYAEDAGPPNIVIIYPDDMGYGDPGVFGGRGYTTPNIDRLAQEGRRFTDFYVAQPVCSASRTALLTGCYPNRLGIHGALGPRDTVGISDQEVTLAEICRSRGYATGVFGKWHLGCRLPFLPLQHGFDEFYGIPYSNDMWPYHPEFAAQGKSDKSKGFPPLPIYDGNHVVKEEATPDDQKEFTTEFTQRAVQFIERHKNRPFFLYLPHPQPHVPLFVSDKFQGKSERGLYGDVMMEIDWSVGEVVAALKRYGLERNTLVIFATDNGPWLSYGDHAGSAGGFREGKGTTFEGGVRVPCIMKWPGQLPAGTVCHEPMMTIDLLPTIASIIGASLPDHKIDGLNALPIVNGEANAKCPHAAYFFYYRVNDLEAMRSGRWKLHFPHEYRTLAGRGGGKNGQPVPYKQMKMGLELFDLEQDPRETTNVASKHPDVVERLQKLADNMREDLGDRLTGVTGEGSREPGQYAASKRDHNAASQSISTSAIEFHR